MPTPRGYCEASDISAFLGRDFTDAQTDLVVNSIARAEAFIDSETGRSWLTGADVQTFEAPYGIDPPTMPRMTLGGWRPISSSLYLRYTPVAAVQSVVGKPAPLIDAVTLLPDQEWELIDRDTGLIRLYVPSAYYLVTVSYTPTQVVPPDISQAAIFLVSTWLRPMLNPSTFGTTWYQTPDISVHFSSGSTSLGVPDEVDSLLSNYRFRVAV